MSRVKAAKSILIVDDDELFRVSVVEGAGNFNPSWELRSAENGAAALALLLEEEADLVVTDLNMPVVDGFQFLLALRQHQLTPQVIVVSAHATTESQTRLVELGSLSCLSKPVNLPHLFQCFERALASSRSTVDGLTLAGFSQLLEIERHTCLLRAWLDDQIADLVFHNGELIDARLGGKNGRAAALEILAWRQAHLEVLPAVDLETRSIHDSLSWLLLEAARELDESQQTAPPPKKPRKFTPEPSGSFAAFDLSSASADLSARGFESPREREGVFGGALVELESGAVLASFGDEGVFSSSIAAAGNAEMVREQLALLAKLGPTHELEDIAMILTSEVQIFRPIGEASGVFLIAAFDRGLISLAAARLEMATIEKDLLALQSRSAGEAAPPDFRSW